MRCPQCNHSMTWGNYRIDMADNWYCYRCELLIFDYDEEEEIE